MKTLTLTDAEQRVIREISADRPGVTPHRIGRCLLRLGLRVFSQQQELVDDELVALVEETETRRRCRKGGVR